MILCQLIITKNPRGWSYQTIVQYPDWPRPGYSGGGKPTLASALWHTLIGLMDLPDNPKLEPITVKGQTMTFARAYEIIEKDLTGSSLAYRLPGLKKFLLGETRS